MLHEFLTSNEQELIDRCKRKVARRPLPPPTEGELEYGVPLLIGQLVATLRDEELSGTTSSGERALPTGIEAIAGKHGKELLAKGFTLDQVVHDYGDLCQAITELAFERKAAITVNEFHTFNRCLDKAIAGAVTEFGRGRDEVASDKCAHTMNERLGFLAHELRNHVNTAMLAVHAMKSGSAGMTGATGAVLDRSLTALTGLIDRSLAEVRLNAGLQVRKEALPLSELLRMVSVFAVLEAQAKGIVFVIAIHPEMVVEADRQLLSSAISNILQNALKFTPRGGHVWLRAHARADRVLIEVEDECGGLPPGPSEALFHAFAQGSADRSGLGLGLSISRQGVEANGGVLSVQDQPGTGCIFTIDLPLPR